MSSVQILALCLFGLLVYSGVVYFLTLLGLPMIGAFLLVYLAGVFLMSGMQRRARECAELQRSEFQFTGRKPAQRLHTPVNYIKYNKPAIAAAGGRRRSAT